jgi:hypothetical protein
LAALLQLPANAPDGLQKQSQAHFQDSTVLKIFTTRYVLEANWGFEVISFGLSASGFCRKKAQNTPVLCGILTKLVFLNQSAFTLLKLKP